MNAVVLYGVLLKATVTAFAGLASLPVVHDELVVARHVLTDAQLNEALVVTRSTPGPAELYVVCVGYFAGGIAGAVAGWLAMITPAVLIVPLLRFVGARAAHPRMRAILDTIVLASAGLLFAAVLPLARDALTGPLTLGIAAASFLALALRGLDTLWVIGGAALLSSAAAALHVVA
ncbi:MAG: chromate transporter [Gammaproteobacteria bacterium]|nr:chromate transporter [Gammaproteobacteria bacterium]MBI5615625.1 chromate transporter [Gammaproteobacteria bacterium]